MLIMYGAPICPDCVRAKELLDENGIPFDYRDITSSTAILKEFLRLRDTRREFIAVREEGRIGIPAFITEDGTLTLSYDEIPAAGGCRDC